VERAVVAEHVCADDAHKAGAVKALAQRLKHLALDELAANNLREEREIERTSERKRKREESV
jgi:hypothetical protein